MRSRSFPISPRNSLMSCRTPRAEVRITPAVFDVSPVDASKARGVSRTALYSG